MGMDFAPPWNHHFDELLSGDISKCTKRIQEASDAEIANLPTSFMARAIEDSRLFKPNSRLVQQFKRRQEPLLMDYV